ncbi:vitamin K epoxide reductase family protein [Streptomyces laurentii]|uniref:vitamin K epoxide reductase family protein n=1 Tax=Streptomyces laurentii TaxID=39478 RepID=UPI0036B5A1DC
MATVDLQDGGAVPGQRHRRDDGSGGEAGGAGTGVSRAFAWMLVVTGAAGVLAAWVITIDKIKLAEDPGFQPGCSINPIVSCGNVMKSAQASVFGFPNPLLGLVTYAAVIAVGAGILAGARYRPWFWRGLNAGTLFGVGFCTWLTQQSLYEINSLCLWCCLAWCATIVMFWYVTGHNVRHGLLPAPPALRGFFADFAFMPPLLHIGIIGVLILTRWWDFWIS